MKNRPMTLNGNRKKKWRMTVHFKFDSNTEVEEIGEDDGNVS